jgi:hypothetical protein
MPVVHSRPALTPASAAARLQARSPGQSSTDAVASGSPREDPATVYKSPCFKVGHACLCALLLPALQPCTARCQATLCTTHHAHCSTSTRHISLNSCKCCFHAQRPSTPMQGQQHLCWQAPR